MAPRHRSFWFLLSSLRGAFIASAAVFVILLLIALGLTSLYGSRASIQSIKAVNDGLAADLEHLRVEGDTIARNELLQKYLITEDSYRLLSLLVAERDRRNIGLMSLANKDGTIVTRTRTVGSRGDNAFLMSSPGRALSEGKVPASIEASAFDPVHVIMLTGRSVASGTTTIGALFANYLLDDAYSRLFKDKYLTKSGVEIAFYTFEHGVYGASFDDAANRSLLDSYFNADSDWIKRGRSGDVVRFGLNSYYRVENIIFPGLERDSAGVLVFVPYYGYSFAVRAFIVSIAFITFFIFAYRSYRYTRTEQRTRYYYWSHLTVFIVLLALVYSVNHSVFVDFIEIRKVPYILYNSTLRLQPESGVFDRGFDRPISVLIDTGDEAINALGIRIGFDPEKVEIADVSTEHSICANLLEKEVDTLNKEIRLSCIIPNPGFSGSDGNVAEIITKPLKVGAFDLTFSDNTRVLADDGLGTNVLRQAVDGSYQVVPITFASSSASILARSEVATEAGMPAVFSPTHSNSARWYNQPIAEFVWSDVGADEYAYLFDQATGTIPLSGTRTSERKATVTASLDGIFYFHLSPIRDGKPGPTRHYKVMIDTAPPSDVLIRASEGEVKMGDVVRFEFSGRDGVSGLQRTMYLNINDSTYLPVGAQTYVPFVDVGDISVRLRVYDKAGNYTEREKIVHVGGTILQSIMRGR